MEQIANRAATTNYKDENSTKQERKQELAGRNGFYVAFSKTLLSDYELKLYFLLRGLQEQGNHKLKFRWLH